MKFWDKCKTGVQLKYKKGVSILGIWNFVKRNTPREPPEVEQRAFTIDMLANILSGDEITEDKAMEIPAVAACVDYIAKKIGILPVKLYKRLDDNTPIEVKADKRTNILNNEPSELFDGMLFKKMMVQDYLLHGVCYAYISKKGNYIKCITYIPPTNIQKLYSIDVIDRTVRYWIQGKEVPEFLLLRAMRRSKDGVNARGILHENKEELAIAYNEIQFGKKILKRNGRKSGYLSAKNKLSDNSLTDLKAKWAKLYNGDDNVSMVLNDGVDFVELSSSLQEMQVVENKKFTKESLYSIFGVPQTVIDGTATEEQAAEAFENAVLPVIKALENALNKYLLLEREKEDMFFAFDTDEALKANAEKRYRIYDMAVKGGIMQVDEVREKENMPKLGLDFIRLGLQDVLYNPETKEIIVPNMAAKMDTAKGVTKNED